MTQGTPNDHDKLARELSELWLQTQHRNTYRLQDGRWDKTEILEMLAAHRALLEKTMQAVEAGYNRESIADNVLSCFGVNPEHPNFF